MSRLRWALVHETPEEDSAAHPGKQGLAAGAHDEAEHRHGDLGQRHLEAERALQVPQRPKPQTDVQQAQAHDGPFLIEFVVDSTTNVYPMVPPGGSLADTIEDPAMVSNPVT